MLLVTILAFVGRVPSASAEQTRFSSRPVGERVQLDYGWIDRAGTHALSVRLDAAAIAAARRGFRAYRPADLKASADAELRREVAQAVADLERAHPGLRIELGADLTLKSRVDPPADREARQRALFDARMAEETAAIAADYPSARIRRARDGDFEIETRSAADARAIERRIQAAEARANRAVQRLAEEADVEAEGIEREIQARLDAIQDRMETFELDYLGERLYQLDDTGGILPNYARIAERALPGLSPLAKALGAQVRGLPTREALTRVLAFIQAIPYDPLEDRAKDPGLLPPLAMLAENRGDCDTKSVAFAALAHLLFPKVPSALILVPEHALLALGLDPEPGDRVVRFQGRDWVLTEPVGPDTPPVGQIGEDSPAGVDRTADVIPLFP
jgi:hypothetical protein